MKILFVTPMLCYPGVPYAGEASVFRLMESLSLQNHSVFVISGLRPGDKNHLDKVRKTYTLLDTFTIPWSCREIVQDTVKWGFTMCRGGLTFRKKAALSVQRHSTIIPFDIIQVEHSDLGAYMRPIKGTPMIISAVDVLFKPLFRQYQFFSGWKKIFFYLKYIQKKRYELRLYRRFDSVFTWSQYDKKLLQKNCSDLNIFITKPYVDLHTPPMPSLQREPATILFSGAMNRPANIRAALFIYEKIFKAVQLEIEGVKFYIVGNAPPKSIRSIGEKESNVVVTGYVENIEPFFGLATVFVSPIFFGGGIIVKNLEAMARGLPVVTTEIGNEGSGASPGKEILTADDAETFVSKVVRLIKDKSHWNYISMNAARFVHENFSWDQTLKNIEEEYNRIIARRS